MRSRELSSGAPLAENRFQNPLLFALAGSLALALPDVLAVLDGHESGGSRLQRLVLNWEGSPLGRARAISSGVGGAVAVLACAYPHWRDWVRLRGLEWTLVALSFLLIRILADLFVDVVQSSSFEWEFQFGALLTFWSSLTWLCCLEYLSDSISGSASLYLLRASPPHALGLICGTILVPKALARILVTGDDLGGTFTSLCLGVFIWCLVLVGAKLLLRQSAMRDDH